MLCTVYNSHGRMDKYSLSPYVQIPQAALSQENTKAWSPVLSPLKNSVWLGSAVHLVSQSWVWVWSPVLLLFQRSVFGQKSCFCPRDMNGWSQQFFLCPRARYGRGNQSSISPRARNGCGHRSSCQGARYFVTGPSSVPELGIWAKVLLLSQSSASGQRSCFCPRVMNGWVQRYFFCHRVRYVVTGPSPVTGLGIWSPDLLS